MVDYQPSKLKVTSSNLVTHLYYSNLMAQKISAVSLRLANKTVWSSFWSEDNKTYYRVLFQDLEIKKYIILLSNSLGFNGIESVVKLQNGLTSINIKHFKKTLKVKNSLRFLSFLKRFVLNISQQESDDIKLKKKMSLWESRILFNAVSSKFLSQLIAFQIKLKPRYRNEIFKLGIQIGVQSLLRYIYNTKTKFFILGVKAVCKGKWSKTASGRTQKITLNLGRLNNQAINSYVDSYSSFVTTKFGVCSVKVWVSYNKTL
nr:ribosomal protein S3 [Phaeocystis rex]